MIPRRKPSRKLILGPRALAVISCALAILTSAPLIPTSTPLKATPIVSISTPKPIQNSAPAQMQERTVPTIAKVRLVSSAVESRRLHILATVEMLHRWFTSEFRPAERTVLAAFVYEPIALHSFELPIPRRGNSGATIPSLLTHEERFAILRNLLAPPAA